MAAVVVVSKSQALEDITELSSVSRRGAGAPPVAVIARAAHVGKHAHPLRSERAPCGGVIAWMSAKTLWRHARRSAGGGSLTRRKAFFEKIELERLLADLPLKFVDV